MADLIGIAENKINNWDPIDIVGDRVRYWSEINNPSDGPGRFRRDKSRLRIENTSIQYGDINPTSIEPVTVKTSEFENNGSAQAQQEFIVSETTTNSYTWTLQEGINTKVNFKTKLPFIGESESEIALSFESSQSETTTRQKTWSYKANIPVPPKTKVTTTFIVNQGQYNVPFKGKVQVRGLVYIEFPKTGRVFRKEISYLIDVALWRPNTFNAEISGTFGAVHGQNYFVRVDEINIGGKVATSSTLDSGVMRDNKLVSTFQPLENL